MDINKIVEENKKLKTDVEQKNNEIQQLKNDITNYINEINILKSEKQKLNSDLNVYINEIQKLKNINNELSIKLKLLESNNANNILNKDKTFMEELKVKTNKINELEDLIPVIFQSKDQKITYAIICRNTDKFKKIEEIFYEKFPEIEENENFLNYFTINGRRINRKKTLAENNINYSDIVTLNKVEI